MKLKWLQWLKNAVVEMRNVQLLCLMSELLLKVFIILHLLQLVELVAVEVNKWL